MKQTKPTPQAGGAERELKFGIELMGVELPESICRLYAPTSAGLYPPQYRYATADEVRVFISALTAAQAEIDKIQSRCTRYADLLDQRDRTLSEYEDKIAALEVEFQAQIKQTNNYRDRCSGFYGEITKLQYQNADLVAALEFYAEFKNWKTVTVSDHNQRFCIMTGADLEYFQEPNQDSYCGRRAREALAKHKAGSDE